MDKMPHNIIYKTLLEKYSKNKVDFVMYDIFEYDNITTESKEKRKDKEFRKCVSDRYNNECIISGTDMPCQVCHIKPFKYCSEYEKYDINNGMILRDDIHTLFDRKEIKINPNTLKVEVSENIMKNSKRNEYHRYNNITVPINKHSLTYLREIY